MKRLPLLWRVFLSTSLFTTLLFLLIGYIVQAHSLRTASQMFEEELRSSFRAYEAVWRSRSEYLASVSRMMSGLPDVRAAFGTGDGATIRDTAAEVWSRVSRSDAVFLVTDPEGQVIASLSGDGAPAPRNIAVVPSVSSRFPEQSSGFAFLGNKLHQIVVTPVYVDSGRGPALINVLLAGFPVDNRFAEALKEQISGSDALIVAGNAVVASTLPADAAESFRNKPAHPRQLQQLHYNGRSWTVLGTSLSDVNGQPLGELRILRPATEALRRITELRLQIAAIWAAAILFALLVTFFVARRLLRPVQLLDEAAHQVARGNYDHRIPVKADDEIGRLSSTFNAMCESIRNSRQELIRQERINTLGRIGGAVVHDLRNPLAAIYSGAEMLVDGGALPSSHTQRIAGNIYRASRQVLALLDDLTSLTHGSVPASELCRVSEVIEDAWTSVAGSAEAAQVRFALAGDTSLEAPMARARIERVFANLFANAVQAMAEGGTVSVHVGAAEGYAVVDVRDNGLGIPAAVRPSLFQPFTTAGKKNGLGLGLALSRQTVQDHGGELTLMPGESGAWFQLRLPLARPVAASAGDTQVRSSA